MIATKACVEQKGKSSLVASKLDETKFDATGDVAVKNGAVGKVSSARAVVDKEVNVAAVKAAAKGVEGKAATAA